MCSKLKRLLCTSHLFTFSLIRTHLCSLSLTPTPVGNTNTAVTAAIKQVADMYDVRPISGTLMHQMKQFVIDGKKMILLKEVEPDQQKVRRV